MAEMLGHSRQEADNVKSPLRTPPANRYTTICVRRECAKLIETIREEFGVNSLGEAVYKLALYWKKLKAASLAKDIEQARRQGSLKDLRKTLEKIGGLK